MGKTKWLNAAKRSATLMVVMSCLYALLSAPVVHAAPAEIPEKSEDYKKGETLYDEGKFEEALSFYQAGAEKGDAWCIFSLGVFYNQGLGGLQKDESRGIELLNKAVVQNVPDANYFLSLCYLYGAYGVTTDVKKGMELLTKASELGLPEALNDLALCYLEGRFGVPVDTKKGIELLTKASEQGIAEALNVLALCYLEGRFGVPVDIKKGIELITKAADKDHLYALNNLGIFYLNGMYNLPTDIRKGIELITKAAEVNHPDANYDLGYYYESGKYVEQNFDTALAYYKKAKELGNKKADMGIYGLQHLPDIFVDPEKLLAYYKENEGAADRRYKWKTVRMSGVINSASSGFAGNYAHFSVPGYTFSDVACEFDKDHVQDIDMLKEGHVATIQGEVDELSLGSVWVRHCWVVHGSVLVDRPDQIVELEDLWQAYQENEIAADTAYLGKTVRLKGSVSAISKDNEGNVYIALSMPEGGLLSAAGDLVKGLAKGAASEFVQDFAQDFVPREITEGITNSLLYSGSSSSSQEESKPVFCFFDKERKSDAASVKKGEEATIQGEVKGLINGQVVLEHCQVIPKN